MSDYTPTGAPPAQTRGISATIRNEFQLIASGFTSVDTAISLRGVITGQAWSGFQDFTSSTIKVPTLTYGSSGNNAASIDYVNNASFMQSLPGQPGTPLRYSLTTVNGIAGWSLPYLTKEVRTSNTLLTKTDSGKHVQLNGTFTQTFDTAVNLSAGWTIRISVTPGNTVTIPSSDGLTNWLMYSGEIRDFYFDGTNFTSVVINPFFRTITSSETFITPPGYQLFGGLATSAGQSGQRTNDIATISLGGCGGGTFPFSIPASMMGASQAISIGAGGLPVTTVAIGSVGGDTSVGSLLLIKGGGTPSNFNSAPTGGSISPVSGNAEGGGFVSSYQSSSTVYGGVTPIANATTNGSASYMGGPCGGSIDGSGNVRAPGVSQLGTGGLASKTSNGAAGTGEGAGGGATQTGSQSGAGMPGKLKIWGVC